MIKEAERLIAELKRYSAGASCAGNGKAAGVFEDASCLLELFKNAMMPVLDVELRRVDGCPCPDGEFMTSGEFGVCDCDGNEVDCESIADALDAVRVAQNVVLESRRQDAENLDDGRLRANNDSYPRWNGVEEILQMMKKNGPCHDARDWLELIRGLEVAVCYLKKEMARRESVLNKSLVRKEKVIAAIKNSLESLDAGAEE